MKRPWLLAGLAATALASCDGELGVRGPCATPTGSIEGCVPQAIETADDACWKLVDCGVLRVNSDGYDWADCVERIEEYPAERQQLTLSCIEAASCVELYEDICFGETD